MKKYLLFLLLLFIFPLNVAAVDYEIVEYYIDSDIDMAGSLNVRELIVLEGTFNGYERDLKYTNSKLTDWEDGNIDFEHSAIYNGASIESLEVKAKYVTDKISFDTFKEDFDTFESVSSASLNDKGVYIPSDLTDGLRVRMYYPGDNEKVAFYISYTVTNAVVMHNDTAELYWQFIGEEYEDPIEEIKIRVVLPEPDKITNMRYWAHGNLTGTIQPLIDETDANIIYGVQAEMNDLKATSGIDIRMTFAKNIIPVDMFINHSKEDAIDKIVAVEEKRAEAANNERERTKVIYYTALIGTIAYTVILIILWIYIYLKYDREYRSNFKAKYYREFIEDYDVEVIDYLINKQITPNAMSASIMNLIYKKNIEVLELPKKKNEYQFTLKNKNNLSENENYLVEFLFETVGSDNKFTTIELKNYAKGTNTYSEFNSNYENWKFKVLNEGKKQEFFENINSIRGIGVLYSIIGFIIFGLINGNNIEIFLKWIMLPLAIVFMLYTMGINRRTLKGNDHYHKWQAFKNFLNDFSILPKRELPEIVIWERYMVYATVLGVADKVQKAMNVRINEIDPNSTYVYTPSFHMYMHLNMSRMINNTVKTAVRESINKAAANSASSSGSGFGGGGFSSGGGFGGGGGGGRGF